LVLLQFHFFLLVLRCSNIRLEFFLLCAIYYLSRMWLIFSRFGISFHRHGLTTIQEMSCFHQIITHVHETMMTDLYYFFLPLLEFSLFYFPYFSHYYWLFFQQNHSSGLPPNDWLILSHLDIAVTDKIFLSRYGKITDIWHLVLFGKNILFKESLPSIMVTINPNWSTEILWYETGYAKGKMLSPPKRPTWGRLYC